MARFTGRTTIEVEGPEPLPIDEIADALRGVFAQSASEFPQVVEVRVDKGREPATLTITMTLETDGDDELDEIADKVLDGGFKSLGHEPEDKEEIVVLESALTPA